MRIFILTIGTRGDIEIFLTLGRELQRRGHLVSVGSSAFYSDRIRASGLDSIRVGIGSKEQMLNSLRSVSTIRDLKQRTCGFIQHWVVPQMREGIRIVLQKAASADYFISNVKMYVSHKNNIVPGAFVTYDVPEAMSDLIRPGGHQASGRILDLVALNKLLIDPFNAWGNTHPN